MLSIHSLNVESNTTEIQTLPEMQHIPNKDFALPPPTKSKKRDILHYIYKGSHLHLLVQITTKHRELKRLPFKCHCNHGESTLTIHNNLTLKTSPPDISSRSSSQHAKQFYYYV